MDVFLMIRRKKSTFFLDAKDNTTVLELKRMIEGITKKSPTDQRLFNKDDTVSQKYCHLKRFDFNCLNLTHRLIHIYELRPVVQKR